MLRWIIIFLLVIAGSCFGEIRVQAFQIYENEEYAVDGQSSHDGGRVDAARYTDDEEWPRDGGLENTVTSAASEPAVTVDLSGIQEVLQKQQVPVDLGSLLEVLLSDGAFFSPSRLADVLGTFLKEEFQSRKELFFFLLGISITCGVLMNYSNLFQKGGGGEVAYYACYLVLFSTLAGTYYLEMEIARTCFDRLTEFMRVLLPSYFIGLGFQGTGLVGSSFYYEATLFMIGIVEKIILGLLIPLSNCYILIGLADHISEKERFSKLAGLLRQLTIWILDILLACVMGFQMIERMIEPYKEKIGKSILINGVEALPFVGNTAQGIVKTISGSAMVIKGALGAAGLIVLVVMCAIPLLRLYLYSFIYRLSSALAQPVSDPRFSKSILVAADASALLGRMVFTGAVLFFFTIAIVAGTISYT